MRLSVDMGLAGSQNSARFRQKRRFHPSRGNQHGSSKSECGVCASRPTIAVKLEAFPFTPHGTILGVIESVSQDSLEDRKSGLIYVSRVRLLRSTIDREDQPISLEPGMTTTADIRTGRRSILSCLLSRIDKARLEAGRGRWGRASKTIRLEGDLLRSRRTGMNVRRLVARLIVGQIIGFLTFPLTMLAVYGPDRDFGYSGGYLMILFIQFVSPERLWIWPVVSGSFLTAIWTVLAALRCYHVAPADSRKESKQEPPFR